MPRNSCAQQGYLGMWQGCPRPRARACARWGTFAPLVPISPRLALLGAMALPLAPPALPARGFAQWAMHAQQGPPRRSRPPALWQVSAPLALALCPWQAALRVPFAPLEAQLQALALAGPTAWLAQMPPRSAPLAFFAPLTLARPSFARQATSARRGRAMAQQRHARQGRIVLVGAPLAALALLARTAPLAPPASFCVLRVATVRRAASAPSPAWWDSFALLALPTTPPPLAPRASSALQAQAPPCPAPRPLPPTLPPPSPPPPRLAPGCGAAALTFMPRQ